MVLMTVEMDVIFKIEQAIPEEELFAAIDITTAIGYEYNECCDEDISPDDFPTVFTALGENSWIFKSTPRFMIHEVAYGSWCIAERKGDDFDLEGKIDLVAFVDEMIDNGFEFDPAFFIHG